MEAEARRHRAQQAFLSLFRHVKMPGGIVAMLTPESPERSLFNCVTYDDPSSVVDSWEELDRLYADAGVRAWTVWVRPGDGASLGRELGARGHALDATPSAMTIALGEGAELDGPDLGSPATWADVAALNEAAYGMPPGQFAAVPAPAASDALRLVGVPGQAVAGSLEVDATATILFVATHPDFRGRGLCSALMKQLLRGARSRGCTLSTLEATRAGEPVYERLGYRSHGAIEMWEKRAS